MESEPFLGGTLILTVSATLNKVIALVYRMYVSRVVGTEALGLYQLVTPIYFTLLVVATAGIPYAVSVMVAEMRGSSRTTAVGPLLRTATLLLVVTGSFTTALYLASARFVAARVLGDPRTYPVILVTAPGILLVSLSSALRGYFLGMHRMDVMAISSTSEQLIHSITTLGMAMLLSSLGPTFVAVGFAWGMIVGEIIGLAILLAFYARGSRERPVFPGGNLAGTPSFLETCRQMFALSLPITVGRLVASASSSFNVALIPARLNVAGLTVEQATAEFGQLMGIALPLLFFPNVLNLAMATNLIPVLSRARAAGRTSKVQRRVQNSIEVTYFLGLPISAGLFLTADALCRLLFKSPETAPLLKITSFGALFAYLRQTSSGALQGLGKPSIPLFNHIVAITADTTTVYFLAASPELGIKGAAISSVVNFVIGGVLNLRALHRHVRLSVSLRRHLLPPGIALFLGIYAARLVLARLTPAMGDWAALPVLVSLFTTYMLALLWLK